VNLEEVNREDWIVGGLALLLAIFLLILPWFDISVGPFSATFSATSTPDGWLGILAFIACLAIVVDLAIERLSPQTQIPQLNSRVHTRFILAVAAAAFVLLKFLFHIHFSLFGWGFYVDIITTAALVYFAFQVRNGVTIGGPRAGGSGGGGSRSGGVGGPPAGGGVGGPPTGGGVGGPPAGGGVGGPPAGGGLGGPPAGGGVGGPGGPPTSPGV
jgi:hypothetical protein